MKTLKDLASVVSAQTGLTKSKAEEALKIAFAEIHQAVTGASEEVRVHGFGTFKLKERAARKGRNPATGAEIDIAASSTLVFKATKHAK